MPRKKLTASVSRIDGSDVGPAKTVDAASTETLVKRLGEAITKELDDGADELHVAVAAGRIEPEPAGELDE